MILIVDESTFPQVESFIPLWEWDIPKKKGGKKKKGKTLARKTPEEKLADNGGAYIEEVVENESPDSSRPGSRSARVEEVPDEDS